jgi:RNA methyltransferase, TrmH family
VLSKNQIKYITSLKQKKFREEHNLFIAEGTKIVSELLTSSIAVKQIYATSEFLRNNKIENTIERFEIKANELERISALHTPNEVLAVCEIPTYHLETNTLKDKLTLVLDNIQDPGNLGTIIRIADWFAIEDIICSPTTADIYNPKVVQSTMGSIARIKIHYTDLESFLQSSIINLQLPIYGAVLNGKNIYKSQLPQNALIIIGNESKGISEKLIPFITNEISIPSFSQLKTNTGEAESLNAAIATSIICSEFRRSIINKK